MQSLYTAASGLSSQQKRLDTLASNIANSNTPGYKSTRVDFKDALYNTMENPVLANAAENNLLTGSGVLLDATSLDFAQGVEIETGLPLDFAIEGNGFFQVQKDSGEVVYTRSGSFGTAVIDGASYLVTNQGYFVLDSDGNRIKMPENGTEFNVSKEGIISTGNGSDAAETIGTIGIVSFTNPSGLTAAGDTSFSITEVSGQPEKDTGSILIQGKLESSNVDLAQELTLLIRSQRAYSLASRALTTSDDMMGLANNMH
jgi:flagellar basal-body rod protein FlgG